MTRMFSPLLTISELFQTCLPMRSKRVCRRVVQFVQYSECACHGIQIVAPGSFSSLTSHRNSSLNNSQHRLSTCKCQMVKRCILIFSLKPDMLNMFQITSANLQQFPSSLNPSWANEIGDTVPPSTLWNSLTLIAKKNIIHVMQLYHLQ